MTKGRLHTTSSVLAAVLSLVVACACIVGCSGSVMDYGTSSGGTGETLEERVASGLSVKAQRGSKTLQIERPALTGARPKDIKEGTWTVFVYLCGSDLETNGGAATADMNEMKKASGGENVRFVVETGGAKQWRGKVDGKKLTRHVIQNGAISEVDSVKAADMGEPNTLSDFLTWGLKTYPSEHMGLIMWDHGGGSISGVCFDECNKYDSLLLRELELSMAKTALTMWKKFDFVGFDACLMGTLETANMFASYADYMIASQEVEPGTGWEYSSIVKYLSEHPKCTGDELGKALCDSYLGSLPERSVATATLSVIDLSQIDGLLQSFYNFSEEMFESGSDQGTLATMTRGIRSAECYGTNNWMEGYTNMVDLGGMVNACAAVTPSADDVRDALSKAVTYQVRGRSHRGSSGLSVYYPLSVKDSRELTAFQTVAANPSYLSYVDRLAHGATYGGGAQATQYTSYSDESWYGGDQLWSLLMDEDTIYTLLGALASTRSVDPRWEYVDEHDGTSQVVTFAQEPQVDDEGVYWMQFDEDGINNVASADALVYRQTDDGKSLTLGETYEVYTDWNDGTVEDAFDGKWLSLPDGQNLCLYVVESNEDEATFTSPVRINGEDCYLRMHQDLATGAVEVEGKWTGSGENGLVNRSCLSIEPGDKIVPLYSTQAEQGNAAEESYDVEGKEYEVPKGGLTIDFGDLPLGTYRYSFNITDVYGDRYVTDPVQFDVDEDGIYFVAS